MEPGHQGRLFALALRHPLVASALIWLASRLIVIVGILIGPLFPINLHELQADPGPEWYASILRFDGIWYASIITDGYQLPPSPLTTGNLVFYPLYPLLAKGLSLLTGLTPGASLLVVANLAALLMVIALATLVRREHDTRTALLAVSLLSFYPASMFFSAAYTESLALLFGLLAFLALREQRLFLAAVLSGLMLATRSVGIVMIPVLLMALWQQERRVSLPVLVQAGILGLVASSGLLAFMGYQWWAFGNPFLFSEGQAAWTHGLSMQERFVNALLLKPLASTFTIGTAHFLIVLALLIAGWRRIRPDLVFYGLAALLLPYVTLSGGAQGLNSMARFSLMAFPAFIIAALLPRSPKLIPVVIGLFALGLLTYTVSFTRGHWVG